MNTLLTTPRILIAGIGNIFMADDAFGCEVARRLAQRSLPDNVRVVDFGIRSLDLTYAMLDRYDAVILVDAVPRGEAPGTLYVIEPQQIEAANVALDAHGMDPVKVLQAVSSMGSRVDHVLIVGCEPTPRDPEADWEESLSPPVQAAIEPAISLVESLITKAMDETNLEVFIMNLYTLAVANDVHETVRWFDIVGGALLAIVILWILIEMILMIPDFIRTVKIHMM